MTFNGGHPIGDFPLVIQQLMPIMIYDQIGSWGSSGRAGGGTAVLRYPGAVFTDTITTGTLDPPASGFLVRIPKVNLVQTGTQWEDHVSFDDANDNNRAVQEILPSGYAAPETVPSGSSATTPMDLASPQRGVVALRINYPYQSATMSGFVPPSDLPPGWLVEPILGRSSRRLPADAPGLERRNGIEPDRRRQRTREHRLRGRRKAWVNRPPGPTRSTAAASGPIAASFRRQAIYRREVFQ